MKNLKNKVYLSITALMLAMSSQMDANFDDGWEYEKSIFPSSWCINRWFVEADLLYLQAFEDGVSDPWEPVHNFSPDSSSYSCSTSIRMKGLGKVPRFRWDLGYRIGGGLDFQDCQWRLAAFWTHFAPNKTKCTHHAPSWKLDYDTIDLTAGYKCKFNHCFTLDAYAGLRIAKIDTRAHGFKTFTTMEDSHSFVLTNLHKKEKQSFEGLGAFIGFRADFDLGCGFTVYADGDAGSLFGRNHLHFDAALRQDSSNKTHLFFKRRQIACQYFIDSSAGIRWSTCLWNSTQLTLKLGVEHHYYFSYNKIGKEGGLCIDGGTLAAAISF